MAFWNRKPKDPELRTITFQDLWGSGQPSPTATQVETALSLAPVFAAVNLIAGQVASYPLQAYRKQGDVRKKIDPPALLRDPTMFGTPYDWVHRCVVSMALKGNAYGLITESDDRGFPSRIEWLDPDSVAVDNDLSMERPIWKWNGNPIPPDQLVHIPYFTMPGRVLGLSPIKVFASITETGILTQNYGRDFFKNSAVPPAVLESQLEVDENQAKLIKQRFRNAAKGREPVVMGVGTVYKKIGIDPEEAAFITTLRMNATQIAGIYGLPPEMIGGAIEGRTVNYQNTEQRGLDVINYGLRRYMVAIEAALYDLFPRPQFVKFNIDAYNRADLKTRYEAHAIALGGSNNEPFLTVDEVREIENREPMPESEKPKPPAPPPQMALPGIDQPKATNGQPANQEAE
jgi:HK97 family phage portal protein